MVVKPQTYSSIICSICEGRYAYGLASLINSCIANGFKGLFYIAVRNELPFWISGFEKQNNEFIINENCSIQFEKVSWEHHLSYYKPFLIKNLLEDNPSLAVFYFDPDITLECDWIFFEDWIKIGPALCTDGNYPVLGKKHPWVMSWKNFFDIKEIKADGDTVAYVNSGFIGLKASQLDIIKTWIKFTNLLVSKGHNLKSFGPTLNQYKRKRAFSVCGDQDILNAVLLSENFNISLIGLEGMGFNGSSYLMFHNIGKKTWDKNFLKEFLTIGARISMADDAYLNHIQGTINPYNSLQLLVLKINVKITKLLQRIL
jgi:hypothetical protein